MSDWYPAIRECCAYWDGAAMLHQTFQSFESDFAAENDACIDSAKSIVESVCQIIVDELDDPSDPQKPGESNPKFSKWVSCAVRVLKLGRTADAHVRDLISAHNKLAEALGKLRNDCGPVSHGKPAFLDRLSQHHRRAAVLAADAIVALLHQAYLKAEWNLARTREPYDRFSAQHEVLDAYCAFEGAEVDEDGSLAVSVALPGGADPILIDASPSQFLFHLDRPAYIEALNAAMTARTAGVPLADEGEEEVA